jgi:hypothetical protein
MNSTEKAAKERYISRLKKQIEVNEIEKNTLGYLHDGGVFCLSEIIFKQVQLLEYLQNNE